MQTIDSYVVYSTVAPWRPGRKRARRVAVSLASAIAVAAGLAVIWRSDDLSTTASRPKSDARAVAESSTIPRSDDEARIAAFQEAAAIAHLTFAAPAASVSETPATGLAFKPTGQPARKPAQKPAPKSVMVAPPLPQSRPATPEVIMADLPPAPPVDPAPEEGKPQLLGTIAQDVERVPSEVQDFAHGMTDRMIGALAGVRGRVGL